MYSTISGGNGNTINASGFASVKIMLQDQVLGLDCLSNFVKLDGSITYVKDTAFLWSPTIFCRNRPAFDRNRLLTFTAFPSLSSVYGGSVALSLTTGIISGTTGPRAVNTTYVGIAIVDSATGLAGYFGFFVSVSDGEYIPRVAKGLYWHMND